MTGLPPLGRLSQVPPHAVWPHEALDFTPWLLDNADVLSDVLGMDLELEAAEHPIGGFSLDLIGKDRASGERVIIENQLETSNHGHLGQILTYAGGTDPSTIIWVAPAFRDEHRAALEWLNERTDENTRFFAVQVSVVKIGDSLPAPLLTLVVQPNDWGKAVKATTSAASKRWTREDLLAALRDGGWSALADSIGQLLDAHLAMGASAELYWGEGQRPSVTAVIDAGGKRLQPWSVFTYGAPDGGPVWALNLDWIHKSGRAASAQATARVVERLTGLPGIAEGCAGAEAAGWKRRPSIPARPLFTEPTALDRIRDAMVELHAALAESSSMGEAEGGDPGADDDREPYQVGPTVPRSHA